MRDSGRRRPADWWRVTPLAAAPDPYETEAISAPVTAPPQRDSFVARQPIFDGDLAVVGYELLFRSLDAAGGLDRVAEAAAVLVDGLDACGLGGLVTDRRVWLRLSPELLHDPDAIVLPAARTALILPELAGEEPELAAVRELRDRGYLVAAEATAADAVTAAADVIRWNLGDAPASLEAGVAAAHARGATPLAAGVESRDQQRRAAELGFELLQGSFFCEPESLAAEGPAPSKLATLEVLTALQQPDIDFGELERLINRDVVLSYRLLRYINSAFFGLRRPVESVSQVVVLLGLSNLKRWVTMTVVAGIDAHPAELVTTALVRARFCELAGGGVGRPEQLFTLGLFSVLDALMEMPMADVLRPIPLSEEMKRALISHHGPAGDLLDMAVACEHGAAPINRDREQRRQLAGAYAEALAWANAALAELAEP